MRLHRKLAAVLAIVPAFAVAQTSSTYFNIQKVADGVYAAVAKPGVFCNGAFIVTNDGFLLSTRTCGRRGQRI